MLKKLLSWIIIGFLFAGCETDFTTIAPYKETMVVYGFVSCTDSINYIKVNRAFLGEGNTLVMAQQKDSTTYPISDLEIWVERTRNNFREDSTPVAIPSLGYFDTTTVLVKEPGIFYNQQNLLYIFRGNLPLDGESKLTIHIKNLKSGNLVTATTLMQSRPNILTPSSALDFNMATQQSVRIRNAPSVNTKVYDFTLRFHYREISLSTGAQEYKTIDWDFPEVVSNDFSLTSIDFNLFRPKFYEIVGNTVRNDPDKIRRIDSLPIGFRPLEFIFYGGTEDWYLYNFLNETSTTLVQEKPLFTNVNNGIGIFTSLYSYSVFKNLNAQSIDTLTDGYFTGNLNFVN
ncbi:MAG: hypothetical protein RIQ89_1599 [Bacteroidota bacterium]|jgi:hypothetical protein